MKLSEFSVKNSLFVNLLSAFIVIAGLFSMFALRKEAFPPVSMNVVLVSTAFRGASAEKVERLVTTPLEKEIREVGNIDEIVSSSDEGVSTIRIRISEDIKDTRDVVNDIQRAVDRVTDLPEDVDERPVVTEITSDEIPVLKVALSGQMDEFSLRKYADDLKDLFEEIDGVASVERFGWRDEQFLVQPDVDKMQYYHISFAELAESLRVQNVDTPGGKLRSGGKEFVVKVRGELKTKEDIENTVIRANDLGNYLKVKDVATVIHAFEDDVILNKSFGTRAITLMIMKRKKGDIINIVSNVHKIIKEFKEKTPPELKIGTFYDMSYYVQRRLDVLRSNGTIGLLLVIIVLFTFLPPIPALMTSLGIPIAMFTTFWIMYSTDLTINLMTMFGLITVLGMVVDDGIIISENVYRYLEKGIHPREAAIHGADEVMRPVLATVLTTICAFSPLLIMQGIIGRFVKFIPLVIIIALGASLIEAFIILPSHLADFARPAKDDGPTRRGERWFDRLRNRYGKFLVVCLNNRYKVLGIVAGTFLLSLVVAKFFLPFVLFPGRGIEQFLIRLEAKPGMSLETTNEFISRVEKIVDNMPSRYLDAYDTSVGDMTEERGYDPNSKKGSNFAQVTVYLTPASKRDKSDMEVAEMLKPDVERLFKELKPLGVEKLYFHHFQEGPAVGRPIDIRVRGDDFDILRKITDQIKDYLATLKGVEGIADNYTLGSEEIKVVIDEEKAQQAYLTNSQIAFSIRATFSGVVATTIKREKAEKEIQVLVRLPQEQRDDFSVFDKVTVSNKFGNLIPLREVIKYTSVQNLSSVKHIDGKRFIAVTADVDNQNITSLKANALIKKKFKDIASDYPGYTLRFSGENEETEESLQSLYRAFFLAALLIFLILATQFNSLMQPFVVMLTIPFGLIGFVFAFLVHREPLSFLAIMGFVGLSGVAVNDSIVLVDFINKRRNSEIPLKETILEAGTLRLRPVLITTITTVCGLSTVAYGIGGFDPFLKPMALAISWGLIFATVLTLIFIPCIYLIIEDVKNFAQRLRGV